MDNWFQVHSIIMNYLNAFQYAVSTEGDRSLRERYQHYVTSESCKLAQASNSSGEKRILRLNHQAEEIQKEFGKFKLLSDMKRREREEDDQRRLQLLRLEAQKGYGDSRSPRRLR